MKSKPQTERFIDIRKRREALHLIQADMAVAIGVSRLTYINYEKDMSKIPLGKYILIEDIILNLEERMRELQEKTNDQL